MGRIVSIDYGLKRSGIAVTDSLRIIASPLKGMETSLLNAFLEIYVKQEDVDEIIIGYPRHHDGTKMILCDSIDAFIQNWQKKHPSMPVIKVDEAYSSVEAKELLAQSQKKRKQKEKKENLDMFSALVILRRYLRYD